ncbi:MAG: adenylate/guanylate cyclase domain-containing protein, partial [Pirellulaceae bacterium]
EIHQLLPPRSENSRLADEHLAAYELALDALQSGDWEAAFELLHRVPDEDRVKDFLTVYIAQHRRTPPPHWDGVIDLQDGYV